MGAGTRVCVECGKSFYSHSSYIICDHCRNIIMLGYDVDEKTKVPHNDDYTGRSFKQVNTGLLEECRRADRCGKSYGYYKADIREVQRGKIKK